MIAVFKREFRACMHTLLGPLFIAALLLATGGMAAYYNFWRTSADIAPALAFGEYALMLLIPALCMRSMAADRKSRTELKYLSLPLRTGDVVLGKYMALLAILAIPTGVLCLYPLIFSLYGTVSFGAAYVSLLAFFLMGAGLIALCIFLSSLTSHPLVAGGMGVAAMAALYGLPLLGTVLPEAAWLSYVCLAVLSLGVATAAFFATRRPSVAAVTAALLLLPLTALFLWRRDLLAGQFPRLLISLSPFTQFESMTLYRLFDLRALAVFLAYVVLFLYLTAARMNARRRA